MAIQGVLHSNYEHLVKLYADHLDTALYLQKRVVEDILPGLVDEFQLDSGTEERVRQWLEDIPSIFRVLKRNKFIASFAMESLRTTIAWRIRELPHPIPGPPTSLLRCFPSAACDPFGRPIVLLKLATMTEALGDVRQSIINSMEILRLHLMKVNVKVSTEDPVPRPVLQCVMLLDVDGVSLHNLQRLDLATWYIYELMPRFPGMLAAVFILNYTWSYSGMWGIAKRALPASALSRVFFPSPAELIEYFSPSSLPHEFGGCLPPLSKLEDPLRIHTYPLAAEFVEHSRPRGQPSPPHPPSIASSSVGASLSPTSSSNPFFGYPVSYHTSTPTLRHGRRRKRDLLRTLARLFWARWHFHISASLCLLLVFVAATLVRRFRKQERRGLFEYLTMPPRLVRSATAFARSQIIA
ncbi:CRAL-TRIO domain-containing protein [Sparassis latifolia]|uniref:CRAL-TRIO domain-containing protein n=1 Tax=Sparassis crispa TaxID=139825 RepID=A0A401GE58_9APHY|nr:hypothetical protein SCP_0301830 [Sparassis crispa]GBE80468.1 hypothetical protein SCP_0301830 [Sparassis crispa]